MFILKQNKFSFVLNGWAENSLFPKKVSIFFRKISKTDKNDWFLIWKERLVYFAVNFSFISVPSIDMFLSWEYLFFFCFVSAISSYQRVIEYKGPEGMQVTCYLFTRFFFMISNNSTDSSTRKLLMLFCYVFVQTLYTAPQYFFLALMGNSSKWAF